MCIRDRIYTQKEITVADALAESVNTVAVRVGEEAGIRSIYSLSLIHI